MGSESDMPVAKKAFDVFDSFCIKYSTKIMSAHRAPDVVADFAKKAKDNGVGVVIAFAGMAAHLGGAIAANTTLPVIGVPCKGGLSDGLDALLSTVQMPSGVPVATVAVNGGANAAYLAAQILALSDDSLAQKLEEHKQKLRETAKNI